MVIPRKFPRNNYLVLLKLCVYYAKINGNLYGTIILLLYIICTSGIEKSTCIVRSIEKQIFIVVIALYIILHCREPDCQQRCAGCFEKIFSFIPYILYRDSTFLRIMSAHA